MTGSDAPRRKFPPLAADHPLVGDLTNPCPACDRVFVAGDVVTLVAIGPGEDAATQALARAGEPYNAGAIAAHWACVTGEAP